MAGVNQTLEQRTLADDLTTSSMDEPQASVHTTYQSTTDSVPAAQLQGTAAAAVSFFPPFCTGILPAECNSSASQAPAVINSSTGRNCITLAFDERAEHVRTQIETDNEPSVTLPSQPGAHTEPPSDGPAAVTPGDAATTAGSATCGSDTADSAVAAAAAGAVASAAAATAARSVGPTQDPSTQEPAIEAIHLQLLIQSLSHSYQQLQQQHTLLQQQHTPLQQQHSQLQQQLTLLASECDLLKEGSRASEHKQVCLLAQNAQLSKTNAVLQEQNAHLDSQLEHLSTQESIKVRLWVCDVA